MLKTSVIHERYKIIIDYLKILKLLTLEQGRLVHCETGTALGGPVIETMRMIIMKIFKDDNDNDNDALNGHDVEECYWLE